MTIETLFWNLVSFIGGVIITLGKGYNRYFFNELDRVHTHKVGVARLVLKLCSEASTGGYTTKPRNIEGIHTLITDLESFSTQMGSTLNSLVSLWQLQCTYKPVNLQDRNFGKTIQETKDIINNRRELDRMNKILRDWACGVRAGHWIFRMFN